jgi:YfiH family protein
MLRASVRGSLTVYPVEQVLGFGVDAFVTDRFGGVSHAPYDSLNLGDHVGDVARDVVENRRRVADAIGVKSPDLVIVRQVHGAGVLFSSQTSTASEADALVSDDERALAILVADCLPLLLVDEETGQFALVHAGWRGLDAGVIESTLTHFRDRTRVHAFIGPSISGEAYQVGTEVASRFAAYPDALTSDGPDHARLDLRVIATRQLVTGGVLGDAIVLSQHVTDGGDVFFSDRAQRPCGRFALVAKRSS